MDSDGSESGTEVRVFLVGFPRSGTTLLQAMLSGHPDVLTLPETFFFFHAYSPNRWERAMRRPRPPAYEAIDKVAELGGRIPQPRLLEALPVGSRAALVRRFLASLDNAAAQRRKRAWVEKTPIHLHRVDEIERDVMSPTIIHIVRTPLPAIASLYAVTRDHPTRWGGERPLTRCAARWSKDLHRTRGCVGRPRHSFVSYERLADQPDLVLGRLLQSIGLPSDDAIVRSMITQRAERADRLVVDEPWKARVSQAIRNQNDARVREVLSPAQRKLVSEQTADAERLRGEIPFL